MRKGILTDEELSRLTRYMHNYKGDKTTGEIAMETKIDIAKLIEIDRDDSFFSYINGNLPRLVDYNTRLEKNKNAWRGDFTIIINGKPELINVYCSECKKPQKKFKLPYLTSDIEGEWTETMIECENPMCNHSTFIIKKIITKEEKTNVES